MAESNMMKKAIRYRILGIGLIMVLVIATLSIVSRGLVHIDSSVMCYNMINKQTMQSSSMGRSLHS